MASTPASVSALLKPQANLGRNAFPLDHRQVFSIKAGQITPVRCLKFVPNDHFQIDVSEFGITFPMQTAPFLRGRKETVFYSVYNSAVWSLFNQYIAQRSDPKTSVLNTNLKEPRIPLWDLYLFALIQFRYYLTYEIVIPANTRAYTESTDEDVIQRLIEANRQQWLNTTFASYTYDHQLDTYGFGFPDSARDTDVYWLKVVNTINYAPNQIIPGKTGLPTFRDFCQDVVGQFRCYNVLRKLDMLGYGNLVPWFNQTLSAITKDFNDVDEWTGENYLAFQTKFNNRYKLLFDRLVDISVGFTQYNSQGLPTPTSDPIFVYKNLYAICGYNLIFYHMFRNSFYDLNYNPRDFNLDFISSSALESLGNEFNIVNINDFSVRFLDIEYHQWKKDQFTGVLPDTQFGAVASLEFNVTGSVPISGSASLSGTTGYDALRYETWQGNPPTPRSNVSLNGDGNSLYSDTDALSLRHNHAISGSVSVSASGNLSAQASFDVIALKRAQILQEYRQTLMRAGNKTSDVFRALYGGAPSSEHEDDIIPRFLDTFGEDVFIDPVTATANTEQGNNGTLGDLSARGKFGGNSKKININVGRNFGNIFILTYFVPSSEYNSYFIDPANNCLNPEDHYISNFENMGLEPVYSEELNSLMSRRELHILGYAPRYHYLKSAIDVVHGEFCSMPYSLRISNEDDPLFAYGRDNLGYHGAFNIWVTPRSDLQNRTNTQLRDFYINPSILDNIFVQSADARQSSDHIICNVYLDIKATRGMSKVGLMNFA